MGELYSHAAALGVGQKARALHHLLFKLLNRFVNGLLAGVESHIQQTETDLPYAVVCSLELAALYNAVNQFVGDGRACVVMACEGVQELRFGGKVLHNLRREFHKVPPYVRAAKAAVAHIGEYAVETMTEFVEKGFNLVQGKQAGLVFCGRCEIGGEADVRSYVCAVVFYILFLI